MQSDENGKESKWADIDDDEDHWTPDTVVWMDGTKSTLAPQEAAASAEKEQKEAQVALAEPPAKGSEGSKSILTARKPTELGPTKTILKPGASAAAALARQSEAGHSDKASLVAKNPAAPTKSPWAVLPPIDRISPVNPPVQQHKQVLPFASQDARTYEPSLPAQPAREIAADTFDRSWRDGEGGARELFNSANGRYEPVQEHRRGSIKPDATYRKPAVLQRPSQTSMETSNALRARSGSQAESSLDGRRGSSASQGSGPGGRRMSINKVNEVASSNLRSSTVIGHDMRASTNSTRNDQSQPGFSQQSAWQQQMPPAPSANAPPEEDPVQVQERVMKEKRELAKKRKQEEEERMELEKQARLKARLAELSNAGKSRKEREAEAAAAAAATVSSDTSKTTAAPIVPAMDASTDRMSDLKVVDGLLPQPAMAAAIAAPALEEQVLATSPEPTTQKQPPVDETLPSHLPLKPVSSGLPDRSLSSMEANQRAQPHDHLSPRANARAPFQQATGSYRPSPSSYSSPSDRKQQPFGRSPIANNDAFTPWGTTAPSGSVWGTSGIGNGTFESANGFAPIPMSQQSSSLPPPPGMSRAPGSSRISPQSLGSESRSPNLQQQSANESPRGFGPPGLESRPDPFASQPQNGTSTQVPGLGRLTHLPAPIAPPSRAQQSQQPAQRLDPISSWNSAAARLPYQYNSEVEKLEREAKGTGSTGSRQETIKETFRQTGTDANKLGAARKYAKTEYTIHDAQGSRPMRPSQTQSSGSFSTTSPSLQGTWLISDENALRISDPSISPAIGNNSTPLAPIGPPSSQRQAVSVLQSVRDPASPLPPLTETREQPLLETITHLVNTGDASRPLVRLPPEKPKVKLPPIQAPMQQSQQTSVVMHQRPISVGAPGAARPIVMQEAWQARFNGLFNRTPIHTETPPSPPKTPPKVQSPALAVASASRLVLDEVKRSTAATVSLPQVKKLTDAYGFLINKDTGVTSKPAIDDMFSEELSFGSLPKIALPRKAIYSAIVFESHRQEASQLAKHVEAQTEPELDLQDIYPKRKEGFFIHMPLLKIFKRLVKPDGPSRKSSGMHPGRKPIGKPQSKFNENVSVPPAVKESQPSAISGTTAAPKSPAPRTEPAAISSSPADAKKKPFHRAQRGRGRGGAAVKAA